MDWAVGIYRHVSSFTRETVVAEEKAAIYDETCSDSGTQSYQSKIVTSFPCAYFPFCNCSDSCVIPYNDGNAELIFDLKSYRKFNDIRKVG